MLTSSDIFFEIKLSTQVSGLYGLMQRILYLISVVPICNDTMALVTSRYHKRPRIWRFIVVCSVFSENDIISDFIVVVNSMSIFADVIFINLRLIFLTY